MTKIIPFVLCMLCIILIMPACSLQKKQVRDVAAPVTKAKPSGIEPEQVAEPEDCDSKCHIKKNRSTSVKDRELIKKQLIDRHLQQGDVLAALQGADPYLRGGGCGKSLADSYIRALNNAISKGRTLMAENRPAKAGLFFRAAFDSYPQDSVLASRVIMSPAGLEEKIVFCADQLMEQGLDQYRQGRLSGAIGIWEKITEFAPGHTASQNAIRTAEIQLTNLEKIDQPSEGKSR